MYCFPGHGAAEPAALASLFHRAAVGLFKILCILNLTLICSSLKIIIKMLMSLFFTLASYNRILSGMGECVFLFAAGVVGKSWFVTL